MASTITPVESIYIPADSESCATSVAPTATATASSRLAPTTSFAASSSAVVAASSAAAALYDTNEKLASLSEPTPESIIITAVGEEAARYPHLTSSPSQPDATSVALPSASTAPSLSIHHWTLHFKSSNETLAKEAEDAYQKQLYESSLIPVKKALFTASFIWALYIINDIMKNNSGLRSHFEATIIIRCTNCFCGFLSIYLLSLQSLHRYRLLSPLVGFCIMFFGISQIIFGLWDSQTREGLDPSYSAILILIPSTCATLFRQSFIFTLCFNLALLLSFLTLTAIFRPPSMFTFLLTIIGLFFTSLLFALHAYRGEYQRRKDHLLKLALKSEEDNSQLLLERMIPPSVIVRLREGSDFLYWKHDSVSLLFSHIHDFDQHVSRMQPLQVVRVLNSLFIRFDQLTDKHQVFKVETIGDVYLVCSGAPLEFACATHTNRIVNFALDMRECARCFLVEHMLKADTNARLRTKKHLNMKSQLSRLELQIGVHSGGVISGLVGLRYPRFRLMGDTINTASRMSTTAEAGQIQLSSVAHGMLTPGIFNVEYRGEIAVKGKGQMKTYLVANRIHPKIDGLSPFMSKSSSQLYSQVSTEAVSPDPTSPKLQNTRITSVSMSPVNGQTPASPPTRSIRSTSVALPVAMQPSELPGVPDLLNKIKTGQLEEDLDRESVSTSQLSDNSDIEDSMNHKHNKKDTDTFNSSRTGAKRMSTIISLPSGTIAKYNKARKSVTIDTSANNSDKEESTSKSMSQKQVITALKHQGTLRKDRLFSFGAVQDYTVQKRKWYQLFSQTFINDTLMEYEFQHYYQKHTWQHNRTSLNWLWMFLLPLSIYDTLNNLEMNANTNLLLWGIRALGLGAGVYFYMISRERRFIPSMQAYSAALITILGMCFIWIVYISETLLKQYGICIFLIILSIISMFVGLQFYYAVLSTVAVLACWIISASLLSSFPSIFSIFIAASVMYLETAYHMESESRMDFLLFRKLYHERMSTQTFLTNMLPPLVFKSLKAADAGLVAHMRENADVMFSDIVGFTTIASRIKPEDVVAVLNVMFASFDSLSQKHEIYKVETIGDAYVACANVVDIRADHSRCLVDFALAISKATRCMFTPDNQQIVIRVGIHTGEVIAGCVGKKMPRYHLFGETVTIAETMEQKGVPGRVACSAATWVALGTNRNDYNFSPLEPVPHEGTLIERFLVSKKGGHRKRSTMTTTINDSTRQAIDKQNTVASTYIPANRVESMEGGDALSRVSTLETTDQAALSVQPTYIAPIHETSERSKEGAERQLSHHNSFSNTIKPPIVIHSQPVSPSNNQQQDPPEPAPSNQTSPVNNIASKSANGTPLRIRIPFNPSHHSINSRQASVMRSESPSSTSRPPPPVLTATSPLHSPPRFTDSADEALGLPNAVVAPTSRARLTVRTSRIQSDIQSPVGANATSPKQNASPNYLAQTDAHAQRFSGSSLLIGHPPHRSSRLSLTPTRGGDSPLTLENDDALNFDAKRASHTPFRTDTRRDTPSYYPPPRMASETTEVLMPSSSLSDASQKSQQSSVPYHIHINRVERFETLLDIKPHEQSQFFIPQ